MCDDEPCEHRWKLVRDWIGDKNVVNGTQHFKYLRCTRCGEETEDLDLYEDDRC